MKNEYKGKKILVTGGTGSIGSEIVRQLLEKDPAQIRIYARDEGKHAALMREIGKDERLRYLIGDIRDKERLMLAMEGVDIVFHAAAMKHVDICERNPFEAVKTNVGGTQNVIDCAFAHNVEKVIGISTEHSRARGSSLFTPSATLSAQMAALAKVSKEEAESQSAAVKNSQ